MLVRKNWRRKQALPITFVMLLALSLFAIAQSAAPAYPASSTKPLVSITTPSTGSTVQTNTVIPVTGTALDPDSGISIVRVKFGSGNYQTATPNAAGDWSSWSITLDVATSGTYRIVARATDSAGKQGSDSISVNVIVDATNPSFAITSPSTGSTVLAGSVPVKGTAADNSGGSGVSKVELKLDSDLYKTATPNAAGDWSSWSASLEVASGQHTIYARATDKVGNQAMTSTPVNVASTSSGGGTTVPSDTTAPAAPVISSPASGTITNDSTPTFTGTAEASSTVTLYDGTSTTPIASATATSTGTWSATPGTAMSDGAHSITGKSTDKAGNVSPASTAVSITIISTSPDSISSLDKFGIKKLYPTKTSGNEWYVNMNDPKSDPMFRNLPSMTKQPDGSWQVSASQVRMEAWSPENQKWQNVEITEYAKIVGGTNQLLQMYSRGGHHTTSNECLGSAYKGRLYGDGEARWVKEVTHPAYTSNRGSVQATTKLLEDRWVGFKAVIYNFVVDGKTYVRMESYIDDDVTDSNGNLVIKNNWKLASVVEDRGGWSTSNPDFNETCFPLNKDSTEQYRQRDEILNLPGGTSTQNIAAWRSTDLTWNWKYLTVRDIVAP